MILCTHDGRQIYVTEEQAANIHNLVNGAAASGLRSIEVKHHRTGQIMGYISIGQYAGIKPGGSDPYMSKIAPPEKPELTEAQLAERRAKIADMQKDFRARQAKKLEERKPEPSTP